MLLLIKSVIKSKKGRTLPWKAELIIDTAVARFFAVEDGVHRASLGEPEPGTRWVKQNEKR